MRNLAPQYASQPVILIHFGMDRAPTLTVCTGVPFRPLRPGVYPDVPVAPCPLCLHFVQKGANQ